MSITVATSAATRARGLLAAVLLCACARAEHADAAGESARRASRMRAVADSIVLCRTSDSTLRRELGAPSRTGRIHRERILSWVVPDQPLDTYLAVMLDASGTVVDVYWDVPTEAPWVPEDQCIGRSPPRLTVPKR